MLILFIVFSLSTESVVRVDRAHTVRVGTLRSCPDNQNMLVSGSLDTALVGVDMRARPLSEWDETLGNSAVGVVKRKSSLYSSII